MATISVSSELKYKLDLLKAQKTVENGKVLSFDELLAELLQFKETVLPFIREFRNIEDRYENGGGMATNFDDFISSGVLSCVLNEQRDYSMESFTFLNNEYRRVYDEEV